MAMVRAKKNIVSLVRELKPRKDTSRIEVMILRLWRNYNKESGNTIEMVVVDKEVSNFKYAFFLEASLPDDSLALTNNDSSQWSVGTATSIRARFFVLNERLTIGEIIDSSVVGTFVTLGTIETIDTERGWQYLSCKYHNKKVMPTTNVDADDRPLFFCNTCDKEHSDVISRFKLIDNVKDDRGEANFLLFDANAQAIVRHSAAELYDENEDEDFLAEAVSDLFGKRVLFEISVDADNIKGNSSQYVVRLATDDREMVLMLESADDISSGSGGFTATPLSKRKSEQDDDSCLEDQHSVNKKLSQKKLKGE
ncbi:hypothetical protein YC2023_062358 [Brassica napus]